MTLPKVVGYAMPGRSRRLSAMCEHFGVTNTQPHNAAADAAATAEVLHALLKAAAAAGHTDLGALHVAAGGTTTRSISFATTSLSSPRAPAVQLPPTHIATHTSLLPDTATKNDLDRWAADALECARLRCPLLDPKARTSVAHAPELHRRLTAALHANTFEPGQAQRSSPL